MVKIEPLSKHRYLCINSENLPKFVGSVFMICVAARVPFIASQGICRLEIGKNCFSELRLHLGVEKYDVRINASCETIQSSYQIGKSWQVGLG